MTFAPPVSAGDRLGGEQPHNTNNTMNRNTPEFIHRSKILCQLITPKLGTEVFVQVDSGTIYSVVRGVITEIPGGFDGWDYKVMESHTVSNIFFSIDDVVDVVGHNIYLGKR